MPKLVHRPGVAGQYEPTRPPAPILVIGFLLTLASIGMCSDLAAGVSAFKEKDYSVALAELKPLADGGNASAEYYLGLMLHSGLGLPKNTPLAAELIRRAAAKGNAKAQGWMGFAYSNVGWSPGIEKNDVEAFRWFYLASRQGDSGAQRNVGQSYEKGQGVAQDYGQALTWYRTAADGGDAAALGKIGLFYLRGRGVPKDTQRGTALMKQSAKAGNLPIALVLMEAYGTGVDLPKDAVQAYAWAQVATRIEIRVIADLAKRCREELGKTLTPVQLKQALKLSESLVPSI